MRNDVQWCVGWYSHHTDSLCHQFDLNIKKYINKTFFPFDDVFLHDLLLVLWIVVQKTTTNILTLEASITQILELSTAQNLRKFWFVFSSKKVKIKNLEEFYDIMVENSSHIMTLKYNFRQKILFRYVGREFKVMHKFEGWCIQYHLDQI